jgi:LysM repeat protein
VADWRRYAGPAAFLLAVTVAVLLVRSGLQHQGPAASPTVPTVVHTTTEAPTTTTAKKAKPPARRYWTVKAGDTFEVISTQTGVPVATIEKLNPSVASTSLFIGQKLRIR